MHIVRLHIFSICSSTTLHIDTLILPAMILKIVSFHDFPLKADGGKSWKENFQNYGGKDQCIYMYCLLHIMIYLYYGISNDSICIGNKISRDTLHFPAAFTMIVESIYHIGYYTITNTYTDKYSHPFSFRVRM